MKRFSNYYKDVPEKDISLIPPGIYCYHHVGDLRRFVCPYWDYDASKDKQESGYCHFLEESDWENNEKLEYTNEKTGEVKTANEIGAPLSLLWDFCKMCGENDDSIYDNHIIDENLTKQYDELVVEWAKKILPLIVNEEHKKQLKEWLNNQVLRQNLD